MVRALLACLVGAIALAAAAHALVLDDQPIDGVYKPSRWATLITPDPDYKPLLCVPLPAVARVIALMVPSVATVDACEVLVWRHEVVCSCRVAVLILRYTHHSS